MKFFITITSLLLISLDLCFAMGRKPPTSSTKRSMTHQQKKATGKSLGYFQINIKKLDNNNGEITLVADVLPRQDMPDSEFKWKVPDSVKVISGDKSGSLNLTRNTANSIALVISKDSLKAKDQIFFFIYKMKDGERHGGSFSYIHQTENGDIQKSQFKPKGPQKKPKKYFE